MKLRALNEDKYAHIVQDEKWWDQDPNFIKTIRLLNKAGFRTISSCMGHAPGTQYEEVDEWMDPYITFVGRRMNIASKLLSSGGFVDNISKGSGGCYVGLRRDVNWADVLKYIRARL
jgi:hypothetical protein